MKPAPCLNCLVIPICRQQYFIDLKNRCELVETYLFLPPSRSTARNDFNIRLKRVADAISPVHWKIRRRYNSLFTQDFDLKGGGANMSFWKERV
jgi:hypothetical protein